MKKLFLLSATLIFNAYTTTKNKQNLNISQEDLFKLATTATLVPSYIPFAQVCIEKWVDAGTAMRPVKLLPASIIVGTTIGCVASYSAVAGSIALTKILQKHACPKSVGNFLDTVGNSVDKNRGLFLFPMITMPLLPIMYVAVKNKITTSPKFVTASAIGLICTTTPFIANAISKHLVKKSDKN